MKKILIFILIVLLLVLTYTAFTKGINIGFIKIHSINSIKNESAKLDKDFNNANVLSKKTYPTEVEGLKKAIRELEISKQEYENKKTYNTGNEALGTIEVKTYTIHYLWTVLGNYRKDRGIKSLNLDLEATDIQDVYNLNFTLVGEYTDIREFIYDIEDDEQLNFSVDNFNAKPYTVKTITTTTFPDDGQTKKDTENPYNKITETTTSDSNKKQSTGNKKTQNENAENENAENNSTQTSSEQNKTTTYDPKWIETTFTVENIGVTLD